MKTLPRILYHASPYSNEVIKPGIEHSGELRQWDETESNRFVYASSSKAEALVNGIASCVENFFGEKFKLTRMQYTEGRLVVEGDGHLDWNDLCERDVFLYLVKGRVSHGWVPVNNANNGSDTEWKTAETIHPVDYTKIQLLVKQIVSAGIKPYIVTENGRVKITTEVITV